MTSCPHCKRPASDSTGRCPRCGRELEPPPTGFGAGDDFVLEGLEPPSAAPAPVPAASETRPSGASVPNVEAGWELDAFEHGGTPSPEATLAAPSGSSDVELELDPFDRGTSTGYVPDAVASAAGVAAPAPAEELGDSLELAVPGREKETSTPVQEPVEDLTLRAEDVAEYGPAPKGLFDSVRYAFRVRNRRAVMSKEIERLTGLHREAKRAEVDALATLARIARDAGLEGLHTGEASDAEGRATEQAELLARMEAEHGKRIAELDRDHDLATKDVPALKAKEVDLAKQHAQKAASLERAEARLKRADIEIRNKQRLSTDRRTAATANPAERDRLLAEAERFEAEVKNFEADRQARAAEAQVERSAAEARGSELAQIRREIAEALGKGSLVEEQHRKEEEAFRRRQSEHAKRVDASTADARERLAEIGRRVLSLHADVQTIVEPRGAAGAAVLARELLERELDVLEVAVRSYDAEAVRTGWIVVGGGAALIVLAFIALLTFT